MNHDLQLTQDAARLQRGMALHDAGRVREAKAIYTALLPRYPRNHELLFLVGKAECQLRHWAAALRWLDLSIAEHPARAEAHGCRGNALGALRRFEEARASYLQAIALQPDAPRWPIQYAVALQDSGRCEEALAALAQLTRTYPQEAAAWNAYGDVLVDAKQLAQAMESYDRAIALRPDYAEAYWNKGVLQLLTGEYAEGWKNYEWRWRTAIPPAGKYETPQPLWLGDAPISGKKLLLCREQGLGDAIFMLRYVPVLDAMGAAVIVQSPASLVALTRGMRTRATIITARDAVPPHDYRYPMMSLPYACRTTLATIPADIPYLVADPAKQAHWENMLGARSRPRVGLAWSGAATYLNDAQRSIPLAALRPLLDAPAEFHCLQKEISAPDAALLPSMQVAVHAPALHDFSDTAALLAAMDVVISVDTSVAHLAGAMGKKIWILLPYSPDYRWMLDREDSPWYPTATLIRQSARGDWQRVIAQAATRLQKFTAPIISFQGRWCADP